MDNIQERVSSPQRSGTNFVDGVRRSARNKNKNKEETDVAESSLNVAKSSLASFAVSVDDRNVYFDHLLSALEDSQAVFTPLTEAALEEDIPITPYLPEPKSL